MQTISLKDAVYKRHHVKFPNGLPLGYKMSHQEIDMLVDTVLETITGELANRGKVYLTSVGCLEKVTRKGRTWKIRGKEVTKGDRPTVVFRPFSELKSRIAENEESLQEKT